MLNLQVVQTKQTKTTNPKSFIQSDCLAKNNQIKVKIQLKQNKKKQNTVLKNSFVKNSKNINKLIIKNAIKLKINQTQHKPKTKKITNSKKHKLNPKKSKLVTFILHFLTTRKRQIPNTTTSRQK